MSSSLEHTATAPQGATPGPGIAAGTVVDHYVIERELGSGGMGVVYAAFDTELQRRVALKVLRDGLSEQAQQRLLREARAMARLAHPHVAMVYEVGSANGRDFVAMELVDGGPLADWLRAEPRAEREILDAFVDAGRGLAAAHAAGMVHRDFKPHNVLRSHGGRVVVTDFGLAREAADPLAVTQPVVSSGVAPTDSALSDLTVPGAIVGTPAYMAPEQWSGGRITPATDQFAYCVALWEALAGERPFRGPGLEELREQVSAGPATLDASKVPRRLRAILRRGLAVDPAARWPSMDALLARLGRRSMRIAIAAIAIAAVAGTVTVAALGRTTKPTCRAPAFAVSAASEHQPWHNARALACEAPSSLREAQLACLDRFAARIDAIARARALSPAHPIEPLVADPMACTLEHPPALPERYSDDAVAALAMAAGGTAPPDRVDRVRRATDPCAIAYLALSDGRLDDAAPAIARCGDDLARADYELRRFEHEASSLSESDLAKRTREALQAVGVAAGSALGWRIEAATAAAAKRHRRLDDALVAYDAAITHAPDDTRRLDLVVAKLDTLLERGRRSDLETVREQNAKWRPIAERAKLALVIERLDWIDATAQWTLGDTAAAGKRLRALQLANPWRAPNATQITGVVVDRKGVPVAGATVATGSFVVGDAHNIVVPLHGPIGMLRMVTFTTTGADGKFVIEGAPSCFGTLVAEKAGERAIVTRADNARIVLQPTTHVRGRVDLAGRAGMFSVSVGRAESFLLGAAQVIAMVGPDGRFSVDGVVPGEIVVGLGEGAASPSGHGTVRRMHVGPRGIDDLALEIPAGRELRVLVRGNDATPDAPVFVVDGTFEATSMEVLLRRAAGNHQLASSLARVVLGLPPVEIADRYLENDLLATFSSAPTGAATACAMHRFGGCRETFVECVPVPANAALVTIEVNRR